MHVFPDRLPPGEVSGTTAEDQSETLPNKLKQGKHSLVIKIWNLSIILLCLRYSGPSPLAGTAYGGIYCDPKVFYLL